MSRCEKYWEMVKRGDALQAAVELDTLLSSDPEYTGAYYNLGLAFKELGMPNVASRYLKTYLDIDPDGYHKDRAVNLLTELGEVWGDD